MKIKINLEATYDTESDTVYISLRDPSFKATQIIPVLPNMLVETDNKNNLVAIEIFKYSKVKAKNDSRKNDKGTEDVPTSNGGG